MLMIPLLATISCSHNQKDNFESFEDYPILDGHWEEMKYAPQSTRFSLWAPTAEQVHVILYELGNGGAPKQMFDLHPVADGMWTTEAEGDFKGMFYTFNVKINGVWQGDSPGVMAKAVGVNGDRAAVVDLNTTNPKGWENDVRPPLKSFADIIIYEMHHRDFSVDTIAHIQHRGKFLALTEKNTSLSTGEKTGLDHLKELGITHVHILPSFDYASLDETKKNPGYNWGYDPKNYNVPEGSYATDALTPEVRIREFKQMVMALHEAGIRVVMDVVYNHTASVKGNPFERTVPGYFYRRDDEGNLANASGCGNEVASERAMVRKYIVESVCYWAKEYHVDGFRFDLMGIHDIETMNAVRKALDQIDPSIYIYGEGWAAASPQLHTEELAMKTNVSLMPGVAAFSDEFRDSLRGAWGDDSKGAFVIGKKGFASGIRFGVVGGVNHPQLVDSIGKAPKVWASEPTQFISYVSCHDDLCLLDRLKASTRGASEKDLAAMVKLAQTAVLTSQGVPFIFAGDELMRTKKGISNSYKSPDNINMINWNNKVLHKDVFEYIKGLIAMRKSHPAFRLGSAERINKHIKFLQTSGTDVVAYQITGKVLNDSWNNIIVVFNAKSSVATVEVPEGVYEVACADGLIDWQKGLGKVKGAVVNVAPRSALIIHEVK